MFKINGVEVQGVRANSLDAKFDPSGDHAIGRRSGDRFSLLGADLVIPGWIPEPAPEPSDPIAFQFSDNLIGSLADQGRWDEIRTEPTGVAAVVTRSNGTLFRAPGNTGKALASRYMPVPLGVGYRHDISAKVIFPSTSVPKQCFLFDLEASRAAGGGDSEAGIRVKVNDSGYLEIAGDKIGSTMWRPASGAPKLLLGGGVNNITLSILASLDASQGSVLGIVNSSIVVRGVGRTLPLIDYKGVTASVIDRLQVGMTANGGTTTQEVLMTDISWVVTKVS